MNETGWEKIENMAGKETKKELSIEESMTKLSETISFLESEEISLEDSLKAYEQGVKYVKLCNEALDAAEKKVLVIRENGELDEF